MLKVVNLFSVVLLGSLLGLKSASAAVSNESMTIGIAAEFENLNPIIGTQAATRYMLYLAWRPLVVLDIDGKWKPMMIKEIPTIENKLAKRKGEGLETTFDLIDASWGDGTPFTCKDVELGWKVGLSKNVSNPNREPSENISAVTWDKANPKRCTVSFAKNKYDYFNNFPDPLPEHLEGPIFEKYKNKEGAYEQNSLYTKTPNNPGLYDGPYTISEVKLGSHLVFTVNPAFKGTKPSIKKIIFKLIPNNATMEANLRSGNIDMVSPAAGLGIDQAVDFEKKVKAEHLPYRVVYEDGLIYAHIDLNLDNPILADLKVRKALSLAINKKEMIDSLLYGRGKPAIHFVTDRDPWYTDKVTIYKYNKREAAKLLDEAGWKMNGEFREKGGKRLTLTVLGVSGSKVNENIEAYLQSQYKSLGIELNIKNEPPRVFFGDTVRSRRFELALFSWMSIPENSPRSILHSTMIPDKKNGEAGQNYTGYKNPEVDKLIESLEQELDFKKRADLGKKITEIYTRDIPVIPIYFRPNNAVVPAGLKNYRLSGHLFYETLYAENWSL